MSQGKCGTDKRDFPVCYQATPLLEFVLLSYFLIISKVFGHSQKTTMLSQYGKQGTYDSR